MSDVAQFLSSYNRMLDDALVAAGLPAELQAQFRFDSCLVQKPDKELYVVTRKADGMRGLLRMTRGASPAGAVAEANILYHLNHPAVPRIMGLWQQPDRSFLVREYFEGRTLEEIVREDGVLAAPDVLDIGYKIAVVLQYLHSQNPPVIHRDIKPGNIVVSAAGDVKLIDFDIARSVQQEHEHDTVYLGTRDFAAPEQYGYAQTGPATDIYALGIVMLYLITGRTDRRDLKEKVPDAEQRAFIEKCTAFDPQARFSSAAQVMRHIKKLRRRTARKILIALVAAVVVAGLLLGSFLLGSARGQKQGYEEGYGAGLEAGAASIPSDTHAADPSGVAASGNIPGNILCGGIAVSGAQGDFVVAQNVLMRMTDGGDSFLILETGNGVGSLNLHGGYLYYTTDDGITRLDLATNSAEIINDVSAESMQIVGDRIYFKNKRDGLSLYSTDLDGNGLTKHNSLRETYYLNIYGGRLYFADGTQGNRLCSSNIDGSDLQVLVDERVNWVNVYDGYIYYVAYTSPSGLYKLPVAGGEPQLVSSTTASYVNVTPNGIFYSDDRNGSLNWISLDGADFRQLSTNYAGRINVVGEWVFYVNQEDSALWMAKTDGSVDRRFISENATE